MGETHTAALTHCSTQQGEREEHLHPRHQAALQHLCRREPGLEVLVSMAAQHAWRLGVGP
jgi:hypothetical protein